MLPPFGLIDLIRFVIQALIIIIIVDAILTWIPSVDRNNSLVAALRRITEPIYRPIRQIIPPTRYGIDFSPIIAIIILNVIDWLIISLI